MENTNAKFSFQWSPIAHFPMLEFFTFIYNYFITSLILKKISAKHGEFSGLKNKYSLILKTAELFPIFCAKLNLCMFFCSLISGRCSSESDASKSATHGRIHVFGRQWSHTACSAHLLGPGSL